MISKFPPRPEALGFDPGTVRTWDVTLVRDTRIVVPIHVDALVVRSPSVRWADTRFRSESTAPRSFDRLPPPFAEHESPRPRGVHLHWAVPDGLARLRASGATLEPPALPDRWLVARVSPAPFGRRTVAAWLLDSRQGTASPLRQWTPAAPTGPRLTVLGAGDAAWTAYYDNVVNRLAFHDPLENVTLGPIAYLVCGWYADPADDPLDARGARSVAAFEQQLADLGWALSDDDLERARAVAEHGFERAASAGLVSPHAARGASGELRFAQAHSELLPTGQALGGVNRLRIAYGPQACLFHGSVVNIGWPSADQRSPEVGAPPAAERVQVSLGATPAEALAAAVALAGSSEQSAELLTAFAHGALADLSRPDGRIQLQDRLHDAAFNALQTGVTETARRSAVSSNRDRPAQKARPPKAKVSRSYEAHAAKWDGFAVRSQVNFGKLHGRKIRSKPPRTENATARLPNPRLYTPADPVLAIFGAVRSPKHGGDGRFDSNGKLQCRLTGSSVRALHLRVNAAGERLAIRPELVLDAPLAHGGVPPECQELLDELVLLDPGSANAVAKAATTLTSATFDESALSRIAETEQTAWWALRDSNIDVQRVIAHSGLAGRLPSPLAVRPNERPWVPLHVDWEAEYIAVSVEAFVPGEIDFTAGAVPPGVLQDDEEQPAPFTRKVLSGRTLLSPGSADALASALNSYLAQAAATDTSSPTITGAGAAASARLAAADQDADALSDIAERLAALDVLSGSLEHFHLKLRDGIAPDAAPVAAPPGFIAFRSGFLRLLRLRLVDAFGQTLDLCGSSAEAQVDPKRLNLSDELRADAGPGLAVLRPRFTAPARLQFRFTDAANIEHDATLDHGPVCGWLLPDHLDEALEVFDLDGIPVGQLRLDPRHGSVWEPAPGLAAALGEAPADRLAHPVLSGIVQTLFELGVADARAGREVALSALLRVIDSTRWSVDPFGHTGEEHLALLLGHPVAVVRASLRLEVRETATGTNVDRTRVPVRLGALTHWKDGLFGYFVNGDYTRIRCASAAARLARPALRDGFLGEIGSVREYAERFAADVNEGGATPVESPYVDAQGLLWVVPGVRYELALLMEPHCSVHATTGLLPRKELGLRREWLAPALKGLAPTFRFGPVLRDPRQVRMPIPADLGGAWTWTHRAEVDRWVEEEVVHVGHEARITPDPAVAEEGWLRFTPDPEEGEDG